MSDIFSQPNDIFCNSMNSFEDEALGASPFPMLKKIMATTLKKIVPRAVKDFKQKLESNFVDSDSDGKDLPLDEDKIKEPGYSGLAFALYKYRIFLLSDHHEKYELPEAKKCEEYLLYVIDESMKFIQKQTSENLQDKVDTSVLFSEIMGTSTIVCLRLLEVKKSS